jgi:hypothetical protein
MLKAVRPPPACWRWVLVPVLIALVWVALWFGLYGGAQVVFPCPRVQASASPDRLEVKETRVFVKDTRHTPPVQREWVLGVSEAQAVLTAMEHLPAAPTGTRYCPSSDGSAWHYLFRRGPTIVLQASAEEGGCQVLTLSGCDIRQEDAGFLRLMERLLNLPRL